MRWFTFPHLPPYNHTTVVGQVSTIREVTAQKALEQEILNISNREQRRFGCDLQDGLGQALTGLSLSLKGHEVQLLREAQQCRSYLVTRMFRPP